MFDVVARHLSFTSAAKELNLTKGAISYQVNRLETELGFALFTRQHRQVQLTKKGKQLWEVSQVVFQKLESSIDQLRDTVAEPIVIGMSTYFASRWLSPRLMNFTSKHSNTSLRLQPLIDLIEIESEGIDLAIRWGKGQWSDLETKPLLKCPAFATAGAEIANLVQARGLERALPDLRLLQDREGSDAWPEWHRAAGLPYRPAHDTLVIPDPNVRVQAVINGQGVALNDELVASELAEGQLFKISNVELSSYGYFLAYSEVALENPNLLAFHDWIIQEANPTGPRVRESLSKDAYNL